MDFIIDTKGAHNEVKSLNSKPSIISQILKEYKDDLSLEESEMKLGQNSIYDTFAEEMGWNKSNKWRKSEVCSKIDDVKSDDLSEVMKKSVLTDSFHSAHTVPPHDVSDKLLKKQRQKEAEKTKGKNWFGLPATEMTEDIKNHLQVLQMRSVLDPKRFYKKNDLKVLPKYFQMGKIVDSPLDFYSNRLTKKEQKKTLVDQLLADAEFNKYNKRKYKEIIEEKQKTHYKAWRKAKKLKKRK